MKSFKYVRATQWDITRNAEHGLFSFLKRHWCDTKQEHCNEASSSLVLSIWRICTRNDKKITWTVLVLKAWCDTKQENCNEPSPSLVLSIWRICTRNDKKILTWTFLFLKASRFDHFSYPPCSPSCVIFFRSVSQIDYPVSRTDYTTDDSTLPVRLLVWFFLRLSVSQIDYPVSRIDYTTDDSSRFDHFFYPPCSPSCVIFSKCRANGLSS